MPSRLVSKTVLTFLLKIFFLLSTIANSFVLARSLNGYDFGLFSYALAWLSVASIPATIGLEKFIVFQLPILVAKEHWGSAKGLIAWSNRSVLFASSGIALLLIVFVILNPSETTFSARAALIVMFSSLPMLSLRSIRLATMRGLDYVLMGLFPEMLFAPLLTLCLSLALLLLFPDRFNILSLAFIYLLAVVFTFLLGQASVKSIMPSSLGCADYLVEPKRWLSGAFPLALLGATQIIYSKIDLLMLGAMVNVETVGIYTVVLRGTQVITFSLGAVNSVIAPSIARMYSLGEGKRMQTLLRRSAQLSFMVSACIAVGLILFRRNLLGAFGSSFAMGEQALIILSLGHLLNAVTGSNGQVINMTGKSRFMVASVGLGGLANGLLNYLFIPRWGMTGSAIATAITIGVVNVVNAYFVNREFGINTTILNF